MAFDYIGVGVLVVLGSCVAYIWCCIRHWHQTSLIQRLDTQIAALAADTTKSEVKKQWIMRGIKEDVDKLVDLDICPEFKFATLLAELQFCSDTEAEAIYQELAHRLQYNRHPSLVTVWANVILATVARDRKVPMAMKKFSRDANSVLAQLKDCDTAVHYLLAKYYLRRNNTSRDRDWELLLTNLPPEWDHGRCYFDVENTWPVD